MGFQLKLKNILNSREITIRSLANSIDMSEANLYKCFKRDSIETKHLEKIANFLNVPVGYFFDDVGPGVNMNNGNIQNSIVAGNGGSISGVNYKNECENLKKEVDNLKALITEKERYISEKERYIKLLEKNLNRD